MVQSINNSEVLNIGLRHVMLIFIDIQYSNNEHSIFIEHKHKHDFLTTERIYSSESGQGLVELNMAE